MTAFLFSLVLAAPFVVAKIVMMVRNWPAGASERDWQYARPLEVLQWLSAGSLFWAIGLGALMISQSSSVTQFSVSLFLSAILIAPTFFLFHGVWLRRVRWNDHGIEDARPFGGRSFTNWSNIRRAGVAPMGVSLYWQTGTGNTKMSLVFRPSATLYKALHERLSGSFERNPSVEKDLGIAL